MHALNYENLKKKIGVYFMNTCYAGASESVIQRFTENFAKQSNVVQELLFTRHMAARAALYRCAPSGQQRAADCHFRLIVHLIRAHLTSLLQTKASGADEVRCCCVC